MKTNTIILLVLAGVAAYMFLSKPAATAYPQGSPATVGGQTSTQPDTFGSILGAVSSVFNAVGAFAQTTPKTT